MKIRKRKQKKKRKLFRGWKCQNEEGEKGKQEGERKKFLWYVERGKKLHCMLKRIDII
jgi:hypothetical protein